MPRLKAFLQGWVKDFTLERYRWNYRSQSVS